MLYLVLTVLLNTLISVLFKIFPRYRIHTLQAIVVNYWVCVLTGSLCLGNFPVSGASIHTSWAPYAVGIGVGFITIFNLIGYCTKVDGITTTNIANKLSLVIPVLFALFLYHDTMSAAKVAGILLAFPAVYLSTRVKTDGENHQKLLWPALLFVGSGLLDTGVNYITKSFFSTGNAAADEAGVSLFLIHAFAVAGCLGIILLSILFVRKMVKFSFRNVAAGVILGVPNYFSMYCFLKFLNSGSLQSSAGIPVINIGTVLCAALCAIVLFREKATLPRLLGLLFSITAILLIALNDLHAGTT